MSTKAEQLAEFMEGKSPNFSIADKANGTRITFDVRADGKCQVWADAPFEMTLDKSLVNQLAVFLVQTFIQEVVEEDLEKASEDAQDAALEAAEKNLESQGLPT